MHTITRYCIAMSLITGVVKNAAIEINKAGSAENNPWVYNVPQAFSNIPVRSDIFLRVWTNGIIEPPAYMQTLVNRYQGIWGGLNHFQSIKRLPEHLGLGNLIVCTGTDPHKPEAQLFIAQLASEKNNGRYEKNIIKKEPPADDKLIKKIRLSSDYWCVGSVDMTGSYIAIPLYNNEDSEIAFYKISSLKQENHAEESLLVEKLNITIKRPSMTASAVAFTRLSDGYYLLAVWRSDSKEKTRGLDFYFSKNTDLDEGFETQDMVHLPAKLFCNYKGNNDYQNINFINDFNGKLYLIALENSKPTIPLNSGIDTADLYEILIRTTNKRMIANAKIYDPKGITAQLKVGARRPYVSFMMNKHMFCKQGVCNFSSGATAYIPDQQHIFIYSLPFWLIDHGRQLTYAQFASFQKTYPIEQEDAVFLLNN